jgi:electron transport complex protein RnfE
LTVIGGIREFLSTGSLFDVKIISSWTTDFLLPSSAPGAFIILGCLLAAMNYMNIRKSQKSGKVYVPPQGLDCRHCNICDLKHYEE